MKLSYGSIIWKSLNDEFGGNPKCRPIIVITPTNEIHEDGTVVVVVCTTSVLIAIDGVHVPIPWNRFKQVRTGLRKPAWAKCNWLETLPVSELNQPGQVEGCCDGPTMFRIAKNMPT